MKNIVYRICNKFFLTAGLTRRIHHRITLLYPADRYSVIQKTEKYLIKIFISAILAGMGLFFFSELSIYYGCLVAMIVYIMVNSMINSALAREELRLLQLLEEFIVEVHFNYQFNCMIIEAIQGAIDKVPYEMAVHGEMILSYLKEANGGGSDDYRDVAPNNLFLTFYSLSLTVLMYGDKENKECSLYLTNLGYLKEDINIEILKRKSLESKFTGLSVVTIMPVFAIKAIELWAISNMPDLKDSYEGIVGIVTTIVLTIITGAIYKIIGILRSPFKERGYKSGWPEKLLNVYQINVVIMWIIKRTYKSSEKINILLKSIVYPYNIKEFIVRRYVFSGLIAGVGFIVALSIGLTLTVAILVGVITGILFGRLVIINLLIKRQIMIMDSEEEIVRFQSVILMLMHMDRITVGEILREISNFAIIFRDDVDKIINQISYMGMRVFERAREDKGFMPFKKLMDSFLATDLIGIERAFYGMEADRRYYVEKHKQENEEIIMKKSAIAKVVAFIPLCLIIIVKLIIPFVVEGMKQLTTTGM